MDGSDISLAADASARALDSGVPRARYGHGQIEYDERSGRWRLRYRSQNKSYWFDTEQEAINRRTAIALADRHDQGLTVRQWIEIWLDEHDFGKGVVATVKALIINTDAARCPAFIDWPLVSVASGDIAGWAVQLVNTLKTRSELRHGERTTVTLDEPIVRSYAKSGLSALRSALDAAKNRKPQLIRVNPAAEVELPSPKAKNGKKRTKKVKKNAAKLDFLPQHDCARIFFCEACGVSSYDDLEKLVTCEHCPFFYRVAHSVSVMQALRVGEIASQRWERIAWVAQPPDLDRWTGHSWLISTSWEGDTKNGQDRTQALIPMCARLLHRWWEHKGRPQTGLLFCTADATPKRLLGELALFVAAHPKHTHDDLLRLARYQGVPLTRRRIETLRSEARQRLERIRGQQNEMFAQGYDFGWFDTRERRRGEETPSVRPGWRTRLGLSNQTRLHENRDTAATHLLSGSWGVHWSMQQVSEFLGHSDIKVTQDRYAHYTTVAITTAAAAVNPGLAAAPGRRTDPANIARSLPDADHDETGLSAGNQVAPEAGLEPATNRLTGVQSHQGNRALSALIGQSSGNVPTLPADAVAMAQRLLDAAASGQQLRAVALQLAGAILDAAEAMPPASDATAVHADVGRLRLVKP